MSELHYSLIQCVENKLKYQISLTCQTIDRINTGFLWVHHLWQMLVDINTVQAFFIKMGLTTKNEVPNGDWILWLTVPTGAKFLAREELKAEGADTRSSLAGQGTHCMARQ